MVAKVQCGDEILPLHHQRSQRRKSRIRAFSSNELGLQRRRTAGCFLRLFVAGDQIDTQAVAPRIWRAQLERSGARYLLSGVFSPHLASNLFAQAKGLLLKPTVGCRFSVALHALSMLPLKAWFVAVHKPVTLGTRPRFCPA